MKAHIAWYWVLLSPVLFAGRGFSLCHGHKEGSTKSCWEKDGAAPLAIPQTVTRECCPKDFEALVNIVDHLVKTHDCTGVLIDRQAVLVPATCVTEDKELGEAWVGSYDVNVHDVPGEQEFIKIDRKICHEKYTGNPGDGNDIAILILQEKTKIHTATLALMDATKCSGTLNAYGYPKAAPNSGPSANLQVVAKIRLEDRQQCKPLFDTLPEAVLCGTPEPSTLMAWDLGLALYCEDKWIIGLGSYTKFGGSRQHMPIVYTHLWEFREWIQETLAREGIEWAGWEGKSKGQFAKPDDVHHDEL